MLSFSGFVLNRRLSCHCTESVLYMQVVYARLNEFSLYGKKLGMNDLWFSYISRLMRVTVLVYYVTIQTADC